MPEKAMEGTVVSMNNIESGNYSGYEDPQQLVINNKEDWVRTWHQLNQHRSPLPKLPEVDFSKQTIIAVFLGMKGSGGFGIRIAETTLSGKTLNVKVIQTKPGKDCMTTSSMTQPYHLVSVDKAAIENAAFSVEEQINDCK